MYALDENPFFTEKGLIESMIKEIDDELKLEPDDFEFSTKNIIALYRDLVEGGKSQLLFYVKANKSSKEINEGFIEARKKSKKGYLQNKMKMDGDKLIFVDKEQLKEIFIAPEMVIIGNKSYTIMPSASACIVMLIKYFEEQEGK